jgi:hypothetical protein
MSAVNSAMAPVQIGRHQRSWADLKAWRLGLGLVLAPLIPFIAMTLVGAMISNGFLLQQLSTAVLVIAGITMTWSLIAGPVYLLTIVRWRRRIGRTECLLLGTSIAATLPAAVVVTIKLLPHRLNEYLNIGHVDPLHEMLPYCMVGGLILAPFGLFGGWILWRAAVRPAPLPDPDVTAVFD